MNRDSTRQRRAKTIKVVLPPAPNPSPHPDCGRSARWGGDFADGGPPTLVVDAAAGAIVAANTTGWAAWGLDAASVSPPVAIDKAMPDLHRLAEIADSARGRGRNELLTFWGRSGLLQWSCQVERVGAGQQLFLVRALTVRPVQSATVPEEVAADEGATPASLDHAATARLAHELRTPLAAVIAYAEVLKDEHFGPLANARYRDYARHIHESARHALGVADGLLAGRATKTGVPELAFRDLDPAGVVENCLAVARPLADAAGLDLVAHVCPHLPRVIADELSLKQMLLNLITNAVKFARRGDKVTVGVAYDLDGLLRFAVADTGPGMSLFPAVGAECVKGKPGLGIGLPLTRALAEANGAALLIDSQPGRGTCATIAFGRERVVPV